MASKMSAPKLPRLEMVKVPDWNSSGDSCLARARFTRSAQLRLICTSTALIATRAHLNLLCAGALLVLSSILPVSQPAQAALDDSSGP